MDRFDYCERCGTINAVYLDGFRAKIPKQCKCKSEEYGDEWISDEDFKEVFK